MYKTYFELKNRGKGFKWKQKGRTWKCNNIEM